MTGVGLGRVKTVGVSALRGGPDQTGVFTVSFAYFLNLGFPCPPFVADSQSELFSRRFTV